MILNLANCPLAGTRFDNVRAQVREFLDYMSAAGKQARELHLYASDYNAVVRSANALQKRVARAAARAEEQKLRAQGKKGDAAKVKPEPDLVEAVVWDSLPVKPLAYSRHRPVQA